MGRWAARLEERVCVLHRGLRLGDSGGVVPRDRGLAEEEVYRAKYHDYCSAQVAEIFLQLPPDEIFVLAQEAASESRLEGELSFPRIAGLLMERVTSRLKLPPYEVWVADYRLHPERYDEYLLGLWEEVVEVREAG